METKIKSKKLKGKIIYGDFLENKKGTVLIIFLSGLAGGRESRLLKNSSKWFFKKGFSTFTLNLCDTTVEKFKHSLKLEDMRLTTYLTGLKETMDFFQKKYPTIILVGHSFGAVISILFLEKYKKYSENTKLVLWDPSILSQIAPWIKGYFRFDFHTKKYYGKGGGEKIAINVNFYNDLLSTKDSPEIFQLLNHKACIIGAEKGAKENAKEYFKVLRDKKGFYYHIIKATGHLFGTKKAQKELFNTTLKFLLRE